MKVLWFSNCILTNVNVRGTGTWLYTMANALVNEGIELYNITQSYINCKLEDREYNGIKEWILPKTKLYKGLPNRKIIQIIVDLINKIKPDIIHIWGIEMYWGLLSARGYFKNRVLLEMQGLRSSCSDVYYGGLTNLEIMKCFGLKELIFINRSLPYERIISSKWGEYEKEILNAHKNISVQSEWIKSRIKPYIKDGTKLYETGIIIRNEFLKSEVWRYSKTKDPVILTMSSSAVPYKGIHIIIKSLSLLTRKYPKIKLYIIGDFQQTVSNFKKSGYVRFIEKLIKKLGLKDNVIFKGPLLGEELVNEMRHCNVFVQSSYVESYSLALAESMAIGVPSVVSYAGAMPELAEENRMALFYSPSDYYKCAYQIERLLDNEELANNLSHNARELAIERNSVEFVVKKQISIYNAIAYNEC